MYKNTLEKRCWARVVLTLVKNFMSGVCRFVHGTKTLCETFVGLYTIQKLCVKRL